MLKLNKVEKHYKGFSLCCSMEVKHGMITGLIGKNGAGKSTVFKAILGLIRTDGGQITILGKQPEQLTGADKELLGVVLSDSGFSGYLEVKDLVSILEKMYHNFDRNKFVSNCDRFSIPLEKKIKELSTGTKRKVQILTAISHEAKFLILDEPTSGLDVTARDEILDMLREYMEQDEERSILISSHISSDLEGLCDDIYMIHDGEIILHEDTDVLLEEYVIVKATDEQYEKLDKEHILWKKRESFGYRLLTTEKQFYMENYPEIVIEKGNIDEVISIINGGEHI